MLLLALARVLCAGSTLALGSVEQTSPRLVADDPRSVLREAVECAQGLEQSPARCFLLRFMAKAQACAGDLETSRKTFAMALMDADAGESLTQRVGSTGMVGQAQAESGLRDEALATIDRLKAMADKDTPVEVLRSLHRELSAIYAALGDLKNAKAEARNEVDPTLSPDLKGLQRITERMKQTMHKSTAMDRGLIRAAIRSGDPAVIAREAEHQRVTKRGEAAFNQPSGLAELCSTLADAGQIEQAEKTVELIGNRGVSAGYRAIGYQSIARAYLAAGNKEAALAAARHSDDLIERPKSEEDPPRDRQRHIEFLARLGDPEWAERRLVLLGENKDARSRGWTAIGVARATAGQLDQAREAFRRAEEYVSDEVVETSLNTRIELVRGEVRAGLISSDEALKFARGVQGSRLQQATLQFLSSAYAERGDVESATRCINAMNPDYISVRFACQFVAEALAKRGEPCMALSWSKARPNASQLERALMGLAEGLGGGFEW